MPKALKNEEILKALTRLAITHDKSLRELEADHHSTFLVPATSEVAQALKTTGEQYQAKARAAGPKHTLGPPMGYLLMGVLAALQPDVMKPRECQARTRQR